MAGREYTEPPFPSCVSSSRKPDSKERQFFGRTVILDHGIGGPFDTFAEREAHEAFDPNRRTGRLARLIEQFRDLGLLIDHKYLLEQHELLMEFTQPALDHLVDDRGRLAAGERLFAQNLALAIERRLRHRRNIEIERVRRRDMHR